jgi:hypothetical protein
MSFDNLEDISNMIEKRLIRFLPLSKDQTMHI